MLWLINTTCSKNITYFTIKLFYNNMKIFLTMDIHSHFTMDIINLEIDFVTIPWTNTMVYQYHIPKNYKLFDN